MWGTVGEATKQLSWKLVCLEEERTKRIEQRRKNTDGKEKERKKNAEWRENSMTKEIRKIENIQRQDGKRRKNK